MRMLQRLLLVLLAAVATLLLMEGALSLFTGRSIKPRPFLDLAAELERNLAGRRGLLNETSYWSPHKDPRVGHILRPDHDHEIAGVRVRSDSLGLRARSGPVPPKDAFRIAILGDSVAFGHGLNEQETLASELEAVLNASRQPGAPPVVCFTVALPGWNHRNAVHFLLDHFGNFDPEIVIYMPIANDLADSFVVDDYGRRKLGFDSVSSEPLLLVSPESLAAYAYLFARRLRAGEVLNQPSLEEIGIDALNSSLTLESRRRYRECAESIHFLHRCLKRLDRKLAILFYTEKADGSGYVWHLRDLLRAYGSSITELPGFETVDRSHLLKGDTHPNAKTIRTLAIWAAMDLAAMGWIEQVDTGRLPEVPDEHKGSRSPRRSREEIAARLGEIRQSALSRLQDTIATESAVGVRQVYGGLNQDGSLGPRFKAVLKAGGRRLLVRLKPLPRQEALYPIEVSVTVNGEVLGSLTLVAGRTAASSESSFPIPDSVPAGQPFEVELLPSNWTVTRAEGVLLNACCRSALISCR